jgi:hypothetical protein
MGRAAMLRAQALAQKGGKEDRKSGRPEVPMPLSNSKPITDDQAKDWEFPRGTIKTKFVVPISRADMELLFGYNPEFDDRRKFKVLCRPGAPIRTKSAVAIHLGDSTFCLGILVSRRPNRVKRLKVQIVDSGRIFREIKCDEVFPITAVRGFY